MKLLETGSSNVSIILDSNCEAVESHAAKELVKYIKAITGKEIQIVFDQCESLYCIRIGTAFLPEDIEKSQLGYDGYIVRAAAGKLILSGAKPYSCLYAVYHLLENYMDCGFFEDGDRIPRKGTLEIGEIDDVCRPHFKYRNYLTVMQYAYGGMNWWDFSQFKQWIDYLMKKRMNMWEPYRILSSVGLIASAACKMGIPIEHTPWQKQRIALMQEVVGYARNLGMITVYDVMQYNQGHETNQNEPGTYPFPDRLQLEEFIKKYKEKTGEEVPVFTYTWGGTSLPGLDPRSSITKELVGGIVQAYQELFGTDHFYYLGMPTEGGFSDGNDGKLDEIIYSMVNNLKEAVYSKDPDANIITSIPFAWNSTYKAQQKAIKDSGLMVGYDYFINVPGRMHAFIMDDYFYGNEWFAGMLSHCSSCTNPWGDMQTAIDNAKSLVKDCKAFQCIGFVIGNEMNHRNIMMMDLFARLAWNPEEVTREEFVDDYNKRRYGEDAGKGLIEATRIIAGTLLSNYNMDNANGPLFRKWNGGYLPGTTPASVLRSLGYLRGLYQSLQCMVNALPHLRDNPLYRFDLIDLGRTYLAGLFNYYLGKTRIAFKSGDKSSFDFNSEKTMDVVKFMAEFCSAHPQFRLKTWDDWAERWEPILPGYDNSRSNWIMFTALISETAWEIGLDYMADDMAELIEHYYYLRVKLYIDAMQRMLEKGERISGRLVYRNTDTDIPYRISDYAAPKGLMYWSPFGASCEPELTQEDHALACRIFTGETKSGMYDFYEGELDSLAQRMLLKYTVPEDLSEIIREYSEVKIAETKGEMSSSMEVPEGESIQGWATPGAVESVIIPEELKYLTEIEKVSSEYNIMRGNISSYKVKFNEFISFTRIRAQVSNTVMDGEQFYEFYFKNNRYVLKYNPGNDFNIAAVIVERS